MIEYKMLPIRRPANWKSMIQQPRATPAIGNQRVLIHYRVFGLDPEKKTANIAPSCAGDDIRTVSSAALGPNGIEIGDILGYEPHDTGFERPRITHRYHQRHQHPKHLVAPGEKASL